MRKLILALSLGSIIGMSSCSDDFEVAAPYKQITVVYGILNAGDTAHYIRIQKAFMDENKSAIQMAESPDSSFYTNLTVELVEYSTDKSSVTNTVTLTKVDLNNEGYQKETSATGTNFFTTPNYGYKVLPAQISLSSERWYRLRITNNESGTVDASQFFGIVNNNPADVPNAFFIREFNRNPYSIDFARTNSLSTYSLTINTPKNGVRMEGILRFHYVDKDPVTNVQTDKSFDYRFATSVQQAGQRFELEVPNNNIYAFVKDAMGPAPANILRYMDSCDVFVYAGSQELQNYYQVNIGQAGGLTGDNIQPTYTNFEGENVIGVVGSRADQARFGVPISDGTLDSLMNLPLMADLKIRGRSDH